MDRRGFLLTLLAGALTAPCVAEAQQVGRVARIGVLRPGSPPDRFVDAFRQGLRDLGYVEGRTITVEYRWANGRPDQLRPLAADLVARNVDAIVAGGTEVVRVVKEATSVIPVVMPVSTDPVGSGLVASLARPGGNITGFASQNDELPGKWFELLREVLPKLVRLIVLWDPQSDRGQLAAARRRAPDLEIQLHVVTVRRPDDIDSALVHADKSRPEGMVVLGSPFLFNERQRIVALAARHRLAAVYHEKDFVVSAGGFMSYAADFEDLFRRAAGSVDKILKGARPSDLPVEQPTKFEFVINLKTAKSLGLTIPPSLLARADQVIE